MKRKSIICFVLIISVVLCLAAIPGSASVKGGEFTINGVTLPCDDYQTGYYGGQCVPFAQKIYRRMWGNLWAGERISPRSIDSVDDVKDFLEGLNPGARVNAHLRGKAADKTHTFIVVCAPGEAVIYHSNWKPQYAEKVSFEWWDYTKFYNAFDKILDGYDGCGY